MGYIIPPVCFGSVLGSFQKATWSDAAMHWVLLWGLSGCPSSNLATCNLKTSLFWSLLKTCDNNEGVANKSTVNHKASGSLPHHNSHVQCCCYWCILKENFDIAHRSIFPIKVEESSDEYPRVLLSVFPFSWTEAPAFETIQNMFFWNSVFFPILLRPAQLSP